VMVDDLFAMLSFYFLDDETGGGNAVKDLLIPGFSEYMSAMHEELYDRFLLNITVSFGQLSEAQLEASFQAFVGRLTERYDVVHAKYGKLAQLRRWRKAMNMPSLSRAQLCAWPDYSALTTAEAADCASVDVRPCTETGCGRFAECRPGQNATELALCVCTSSDTAPASDFLTSRACTPTVASTDQQRVFWTLSMLLFGVGFVLSLVVINEFRRNPLFSPAHPGGTMWSFAAIAVPDFVLSTVYFVFHFTTLIKGVEMSPGPCQSFALLTTMAVYATFLGPPIVGAVTLRSVAHLTQKGTMPAQTPRAAVAVTLCLPWALGLVIGLLARADGKSGSYRGLLCYNTEWDSLSTGGLTIAVFGGCTLITAAEYILIASMVRTSFRNAGAAASDHYFAVVLKRGAALIFIFFVSWACFVTVVGMNMAYRPVSLTTEMLAALIIVLQPILDTFVLLQTPSVRAAMVTRMFGELLVVNAKAAGPDAGKPPPPSAGGASGRTTRSSTVGKVGPPTLSQFGGKMDRAMSSLSSMGGINSSDYITVPEVIVEPVDAAIERVSTADVPSPREVYEVPACGTR